MRTTLTLDDDVALKLKDRMKASGKSLKETVNETLRLGMTSKPIPREPFKVESIGLFSGLHFESTERMLEELEGPDYR
ncbi:MAG: hypothetical protein SFV18_06865 [Bryobacteraceae bacterium]|nr:hypothetical protein [Bryobacteraceae bacterium]